MISTAPLADAVVLLHFAFVLVVVAGIPLVLLRPKIALLHIPALAWALYIECTGSICPLTPLENRLRSENGLETYQGGFIDWYIMPIIYPVGLTAELQLTLGILLGIAGSIAYSIVLFRLLRSKH